MRRHLIWLVFAFISCSGIKSEFKMIDCHKVEQAVQVLNNGFKMQET